MFYICKAKEEKSLLEAQLLHSTNNNEDLMGKVQVLEQKAQEHRNDMTEKLKNEYDANKFMSFDLQ